MTDRDTRSTCRLIGGEFLDPDQRTWVERDIHITDGWWSEEAGADGDDIDVSGCVLVPGLIDMHVHAFHGTARRPHPDDIGIRRGATTIVDGGSAGWTTFGAFQRVTYSCETRLLCWLNLSSIGILDNRVPELMAQAWIDVDGAVGCAQSHPAIIRGFKARLSTYAAGGDCLRVLDQLLLAGNAAELPVMVHVGDTSVPLTEIVERLRPDDVVTHCYSAGRNNAFDPQTGEVLSSVRRAQDRGVLFDVGRGGTGHFSPELARAGLVGGFTPNIISSDVADRTAEQPAFGVVSTISDMIACGMDEVAAFLAATEAPAAAIRCPELADPTDTARPVDLTILKRLDTPSPDGWFRFRPRAVVRDGRYTAL